MNPLRGATQPEAEYGYYWHGTLHKPWGYTGRHLPMGKRGCTCGANGTETHALTAGGVA